MVLECGVLATVGWAWSVCQITCQTCATPDPTPAAASAVSYCRCMLLSASASFTEGLVSLTRDSADDSLAPGLDRLATVRVRPSTRASTFFLRPLIDIDPLEETGGGEREGGRREGKRNCWRMAAKAVSAL